MWPNICKFIFYMSFKPLALSLEDSWKPSLHNHKTSFVMLPLLSLQITYFRSKIFCLLKLQLTHSFSSLIAFSCSHFIFCCSDQSPGSLCFLVPSPEGDLHDQSGHHPQWPACQLVSLDRMCTPGATTSSQRQESKYLAA